MARVVRRVDRKFLVLWLWLVHVQGKRDELEV